jgi:nanoRNase/pAp phosphatase (c-di-AMP/oligoRNAs hydrolase)
MLDLFERDDNWLIVINADPDALASALALKRIMAHRTGNVLISHINPITRPDNLSMVRYLGIPLVPHSRDLAGTFAKQAIVDSQQHHNAEFGGLSPSIVIDHHPLSPEHPCLAAYCDIRPSGAPGSATTSAIFTEYLRALHIRPGAHLSTALQYGIRTDTAGFTRITGELDLRAYLSLDKTADAALLRRIMHSEYLPEWLRYFSRAFSALHQCGAGRFAFIGEVESPDILVVVADFFNRVHGLHWVAIGGAHAGVAIVIFRGDGNMDLGAFASRHLGALGSAGGHRSLARAEFPVAAADGHNLEAFMFRRLAEGIGHPRPHRARTGKEAGLKPHALLSDRL